MYQHVAEKWIFKVIDKYPCTLTDLDIIREAASAFGVILFFKEVIWSEEGLIVLSNPKSWVIQLIFSSPIKVS